MIDTVVIEGSHGAVLVHRPTGIVIETLDECACEDCRKLGTYQEQVALFNTADLADGLAHYDIIYVGFWDRAGLYEPAVEHRMYQNRVGYMDIDAVSQKLLLPAPNVEVCLHGWFTDEDGNDTYSDREDEITGWCVYLRRNASPSDGPWFEGNFTMDWEKDFPSYIQAHDFAKQVAADYGAQIFEY